MTTTNKKFITYALNTKNQLVHIDEVPNGLSCNCVCPKCREILIAKNGGKIKEHHFAHQSNADCAGGYETVLHLLAKDILKETKLVPFINLDGIVSMEIADTVELEKRINDIVPDVYACVRGKNIAIEIYVTHKIDDTKYRKIQESGLTTFEIDLSKIESLNVEYIKEQLSKSVNFNIIYDKEFSDNFVNQKKQLILQHGILKPIENGIVKDCPMSLVLSGRKIITRNVRKSLCEICFFSCESKQKNGIYCVVHCFYRIGEEMKLPQVILLPDIYSNRILSETEVKEKIKKFKRNIEVYSL